MSDHRIVYLLGAGASAKTMPTVNSFNDSISEFTRQLQKMHQRVPDSRNYQSEMRQLHDELTGRASPDTLAALYHQSDRVEELSKLKRHIAMFLFGWELFKGPDPRYENLITALRFAAQKSDLMPTRTTILTWNYDMNFEHVIAQAFAHDEDPSKAIQYPMPESIDNDRFLYIKLNGSIRPKTWSENHLYELLSPTLNLDTAYDVYKHEINTNIRFAWEHGDGDPVVEAAVKAVKRATVLVSIGYSFPDYNQYVDTQLIRSMADTLGRIYVQDVDQNRANTILQRFAFRAQTASRRLWDLIGSNTLSRGYRAPTTLVGDAETLLIPPEMYVRG